MGNILLKYTVNNHCHCSLSEKCTALVWMFLCTSETVFHRKHLPKHSFLNCLFLCPPLLPASVICYTTLSEIWLIWFKQNMFFIFILPPMMFTYKLSDIIAPKIYISFKQYFSNFWWLNNSIKHLIKNNSIKNYCIWI